MVGFSLIHGESPSAGRGHCPGFGSVSDSALVRLLTQALSELLPSPLGLPRGGGVEHLGGGVSRRASPPCGPSRGCTAVALWL